MSFLLEYLRKPQVIGAVAPSSRFLAAKMLKPVDFSKARTIVELGAGTGVFTKEIIKRMHRDAELHVFEINPTFLPRLQALEQDGVRVLDKPAEQLSMHVRRADVIISALPLMTFPDKTVNKILAEVKKSLKPGGQYIQFQYGLKSKAVLERHFSEVKLGFTPLNVPPAFVYHCKK